MGRWNLLRLVPRSTLFHVLRNNRNRGTALLRALSYELDEKLPPAWSVTSKPDDGGRGGRSGVSLILTAPDGTTATVLVEARRVVEPRDVTSVLKQLTSYRDESDGDAVLMVAAPFLSPRARELLEDAGAGWFDATGNLRLRIDRPSVFLDRVGASRNPFTDADDRRLKSLKGPGAARVVRALLDAATPFGVRALADVAEVGAATSSRVLELLAREDLVARDKGGGVVEVRKLSLARRWCMDYGLTSTNQAVPMLAARGIDQVVSALGRADSTYAITGEVATRPYLPRGRAAVAPVALLTVFVPDATAAAAALRVRPVDRGANVVLVEPFDAVVFRGAVVKDGLTYAAASQVVADLLTGTGRAPEEGAALIDALADQDVGWTG